MKENAPPKIQSYIFFHLSLKQFSSNANIQNKNIILFQFWLFFIS